MGGGVIDTLDALIETDIQICAEIHRSIHHNLLARCALDAIQRVYRSRKCSRSASAGSARRTLHEDHAGREQQQGRRVGPRRRRLRAIGSTLAADLYGLNLVCQNIEDNANNVTRFFRDRRRSSQPTGDDRPRLFHHERRAWRPRQCARLVPAEWRKHVLHRVPPEQEAQLEYYFFTI